ncbi:MAG: hypothetical protein IPM02_27580 [Betaproteobacteria bacterium]|nr:hypothetical protein [Betaproteobacteria bacterium]
MVTSYYNGGFRLGVGHCQRPEPTPLRVPECLVGGQRRKHGYSGCQSRGRHVGLADGRTVNLNFNLATQGGTIEIRNATNQVVLSEPLPTTITVPTVLGAAPDTTPDAFGFAAQTGWPLSAAAISNTITPTGYNAPPTAAISVSAGGSYRINGGAF